MKKCSFVRLLEDYRETPDKLHLALTDLWRCMNTGGFSPMLRTDLLRFNGGLFKDASAIEVTGDDLALLLLAAQHEWQNVEPAIFGTLLERALDPPERNRLGDHYPTRAYRSEKRRVGQGCVSQGSARLSQYH